MSVISRVLQNQSVLFPNRRFCMNNRHVIPTPFQETYISSPEFRDRIGSIFNLQFSSMESESSNSSNSTGGDQGSFNPNPAPHSPPPTQQLLNERSPLRRSGGPNLGAGQLRLAGVSSPPPRAIRPLAMGVPGVSAFSPYVRPPLPPPPPPPPPPRPTSVGPTGTAGGIPGLPAFTLYNRAPPRPDWYPGPGSSSGPSGFGFGYGFGLFGCHVGPVGGSGYGGVAPFEGGALRIGGSPARKRGREEGNAGGSGKQKAEGGMPPVPCPICGREFMSEKALFGHMRSHPNRGYKGVHPPPAFRADEEFADVPGLNRPGEMEAAVDGGGVEAEAAAAPAAEVGGDTEMQPQGGAEENYTLPDLNMPPPPSPGQ
ncbi:uncharacterized protein [Primulina eburnea]|uniref:uncharacterized protein n=1 Tax=Primulina eburnea TaxID=1245227 RepID=UPI003C6CAD9A